MIDLLSVLVVAAGLAALLSRLFGRGAVRLAAAVVASTALTVFGAFHLARSRSVQLFGEVVTRGQTAEKVVALTFDDGPTPEYTDRVLELLRAEGVRATFFVNGGDLARHPELGAKLVADGHGLGNHTYTHRRLLGVSWATLREEVEQTDAEIRRAGHVGPIPFRSPYCHKLIAASWYLWRTGRTQVTWDLEPESDPALQADAERLARHVIDQARPGSIVLLHVMYRAREQSRLALPQIIRGLRDRGFRFVRVDELTPLPAG